MLRTSLYESNGPNCVKTSCTDLVHEYLFFATRRKSPPRARYHGTTRIVRATHTTKECQGHTHNKRMYRPLHRSSAMYGRKNVNESLLYSLMTEGWNPASIKSLTCTKSCPRQEGRRRCAHWRLSSDCRINSAVTQ